ncbi:hypothetical protein AX14_012633 [Amanita brunnescens Koide BX004]|nr:hypothetical protein AX14_012633 [Amanita brunnescens Koide BX004]
MERLFSRLPRCRKSSALHPGQQPHPFDSSLPNSIALHPVPLHIQVTIKTRHLPVLPAELWRVIFGFATEDDTGFPPIKFPTKSTKISFLHFPHSHSDTDVGLEHYLRSIKKKQDLMKVCRQWSIIALEILYECIWIYKPAQARVLAEVLSCQKDSGTGKVHNPGRGHYIKHLHIETHARERCSPDDVRTIINNTPCLEIYTDYRSIRQSMYVSSSMDPASPAQLLAAIIHPNSSIRHLSWTNYDNMSFHLSLSPLLTNIASKLEFLELTFCNMEIHNLKEPLQGNPGRPLTLPHLHALKICLHDATLAVLSTWNLPVIKNVSVVAADFSYAGEGFCNFFRTHGQKLKQLELAHSSSIIEDHYLTIPVDPPTATLHNVHLAAWCPTLKEFICSADVEWNWQNPNWIAPHTFLLSHPNLQLIGIRDLDKRIYEEIPITGTNPFSLLLSQIESLFHHDSFPKLLFVRDMSLQSKTMRVGAYSESIVDFWSKVMQFCKDGGVWLEDNTGMNITRKDLMRARLKVTMRKKAQKEQEELQKQRHNLLYYFTSA